MTGSGRRDDYWREVLQDSRVASRGAPKIKKKKYMFPPLWRPGIRDMFFYCLALRTVISAGVPIISAFEIISESISHRLLKKSSLKISRAISRGENLEKAFHEQRHVFPRFFVKTFITGMKSGSAERSLDILIEHYHWLMELKSAILSAIWYPAVNLVLGALIMAGRDVILATKTGGFDWNTAAPVFFRYLYLPFMGIFIPYLLSRVLKERKIRPFTDMLTSKIPYFGTLYRKYALAIFFRMLATSVEAGRNVIYSFEDALDSMNNYYLARKMRNSVDFLKQGQWISEALAPSGELDASAIAMIATGESSGSMPELLEKMAEYYRNSITHLLPGLIKASYPFFIIMVAIAFFLNADFLFIGMFPMFLMLFLVI